MKNIIIKLTKIILVFLILTSCSNKNDEKIINNKVLVFNLGSKPTSLDAHMFNTTTDLQVDYMLYEGLLRIDKNQNVVEGLAESYIENDTNFRFKLRKGIQWSDGSEITSEDFINGFKRALSAETGARNIEMLFDIKNAKKYYNKKIDEKELGIKYINKYEFEIILEKPSEYFKYILTLPISYPVKKGNGNTYLSSGAYAIESIDDSKIIFVKNEKYWDRNNVKISNINFLIVNDYRTVDLLIKNNELDISRVENYNLDEYKKDNKIKIFKNGRVWYIDFNLKNEYLKDINLRKNISLSIDRKKYVDEIKKDGSVKSQSIISDIITAGEENYREKYPDDEYIGNDISKIEDKKMNKKLKLLAGNTDTETKEAAFIQAELKEKLGLDIEVEITTFSDRLFKIREGKYDMALSTYSPKYDDPLAYLDKWYELEENKIEDVAWKQKDYNKLIEEIKVTQQNKKRIEKINKAEKILIDNVIIAPLYYSVENYYYSNKIKELYVINIGSMINFREIEYK